MGSSNNNDGSQDTSSSSSLHKAPHSESGSDNSPSNDGSIAFGTSPATSGNPDGKTRLFTNKQRLGFTSEISNETGAGQNYIGSIPICTPPGSSVPRTSVFPAGYQYYRETIPDIEGWLQKQKLYRRNSQNSETQGVLQMIDNKETTLPVPMVNPKQNLAEVSAGEFLQTPKDDQTNEASRARKAPSKPKDSEDQTENSKGFPCP